MKPPIQQVRLEQVHLIPKDLKPGVLYFSAEFETAAHLCCCGCATKVVTPIGPGRWKLTGTPSGPTLTPSVGNTSQPCRSHYIVTAGNVHWASELTDAAHAAAIARDRAAAVSAMSPLPWWRRVVAWVTRRFPWRQK